MNVHYTVGLGKELSDAWKGHGKVLEICFLIGVGTLELSATCIL